MQQLTINKRRGERRSWSASNGPRDATTTTTTTTTTNRFLPILPSFAATKKQQQRFFLLLLLLVKMLSIWQRAGKTSPTAAAADEGDEKDEKEEEEEEEEKEEKDLIIVCVPRAVCSNRRRHGITNKKTIEQEESWAKLLGVNHHRSITNEREEGEVGGKGREVK